MIVAEDERGPGLQAVIPQYLDLTAVAIESPQIMSFVHIAQVVGRDRLEADDMPQATALDHQVHEFGVSQHIEAGLAYPADLQRYQGLEQFLSGFAVGAQIVVDKKHQATILVCNLPNHLVDMAYVVAAIEILRNRAEIAVEMTAA